MKQQSGGKGWQGQSVGQASPNIQVCFIPAFSPVIVLVIFSFAVVCAFKLLGISILPYQSTLLCWKIYLANWSMEQVNFRNMFYCKYMFSFLNIKLSKSLQEVKGTV